jgi:hypothetical protein
MEPVTVSFALTRDDFADAALAQMKMQSGGVYRVGSRIVGLVMIAAACVLFTAKPGAQPLISVLMVCGVFFLFLCIPTLEAAAKRRASAAFDTGRRSVTAQTAVFGEESVEVQSERYTAKIPYQMLYAAYADEKMILFCTGIGECRCVPKRIMKKDEQKRVEDLLAKTIKQKFKQEGAREWMK